MTTATYTKLRDGSWGIRVAGTATPGQSVTVTKKSGETKTEVVGKVMCSGEDKFGKGTTSLCTVAVSASSRRDSRARAFAGGWFGGPLPGGRWPEGSNEYYTSRQYDEES